MTTILKAQLDETGHRWWIYRHCRLLGQLVEISEDMESDLRDADVAVLWTIMHQLFFQQQNTETIRYYTSLHELMTAGDRLRSSASYPGVAISVQRGSQAYAEAFWTLHE